MKGRILFKETQTFVNTFLFPVVCIASGLILVGVYIQLFSEEITNEAIWVSVFTTVIVIGVIYFISIHKLYFEIDRNTIRYRFFPYISSMKTIRKEDVKTIYVRKYQPVWEYGGWGYRVGFSRGKAYNVWGNKGLQIVLKDGKQLLLGTQKASELDRVIKKWNNEEELM